MREAGGTKLLVGAIEQVLRGEVLIAMDGIEALEQAAMDGRGGFTVELLVDDALDQRLEWGLRARYSHGEGAGALNESGELGIVSGELFGGECEVVSRRTWAANRTRHEMTVSQGASESLVFSRCKLGLDWFVFTSAIPLRQGRYCGAKYATTLDARDVVQLHREQFDNRML